MRLTNRIVGLATRRNIILALLLTVIIGAILIAGIQPQMLALTGGLPVLDVRGGYTFSDADEFLTALGPPGRQLYTYHQIVDTFFPLVYALTMALVMAALVKRVLPDNARTRLVVLLPFVVAVFDYLENALIGTQITSYPVLYPDIFAAANVMTEMKWILMVVSFSAILLLAVASYLSKQQ